MCAGAGFLSTQRQEVVPCPNCQTRGMVVVRGQEPWAWMTLIDDGTILERRMEATVSGILNSLLLVFSLMGIGLGAWEVLNAIETSAVMDAILGRSWPMAAGWLGILAGCFLGFRWYRSVTNIATIPDDAPGDVADVWQRPARDMITVVRPVVMTVLERAWQHAAKDGDRWITPAHILASMTHTPEVGSMLVRMGIDPAELRDHLAKLSPGEHHPHAVPVPSLGSRTLLAEAFRRAADANRPRIDLVHLLAAYGNLTDPTRELLYDLKVDDAVLGEAVAWLDIQESLRHRIRRYQSRSSMKPKGNMDRAYTAVATPILNQFSTDLTLLARNGHIPFIVGRDEELESLFRIIETNRRSVLIVGDSGVGKTSILHALAERMVAEDVPSVLQDKRLVSLSAASLVAGSGGAGQLEGRIESVLTEIARSGNIVLAIENFDQLVGASSAGSENLDAAQIIAEAAANRTCIVIGTTTLTAYHRTLERGVIPSAFERLELDEMEPPAAIRVLQSRVGPLEHRYGVYFTFNAIDKAVSFARRYMRDKTLPGSALDLLEEAAVIAGKEGKHALVTGEHIARLVSQRTKVDVTEITSGEQTKLLKLEELMHARVIGQSEAVSAVSDALRRARTELRDEKRPIASFLFLGPTGVGKTELAKTVAEVYFGSEEAMIRLDMSEYQDIASISRLIGEAGSGGTLTDAVRERPYSLVLLDELEKAHPDVLNIFLQVMDDGRLTDGAGRTIDFTSVILIATSNAGTSHIQDRLKDGAALTTIKSELIEDVLQKIYRPEFLNRFDGIIVFTPLNEEEIEKIVALMIGQIAHRLNAKGITLKASPEAIAELARIGFDPLFGARPLRRAVQDHVDNALARFLLEGKIGRRDVAVLEAGGAVRVEKAAPIA